MSRIQKGSIVMSFAAMAISVTSMLSLHYHFDPRWAVLVGAVTALVTRLALRNK